MWNPDRPRGETVHQTMRRSGITLERWNREERHRRQTQQADRDALDQEEREKALERAFEAFEGVDRCE